MAENAPRGRNTRVRLHGKEIVQIGREEAPTFYANNVLLQSSVWDVKLNFGLLVDSDDETVTVQSIASVILSPQHAKAVSEILNTQIAHYEATYGLIPSDARAKEASNVEGE